MMNMNTKNTRATSKSVIQCTSTSKCRAPFRLSTVPSNKTGTTAFYFRKFSGSANINQCLLTHPTQ